MTEPFSPGHTLGSSWDPDYPHQLQRQRMNQPSLSEALHSNADLPLLVRKGSKIFRLSTERSQHSLEPVLSRVGYTQLRQWDGTSQFLTFL